MFEHLEEIDWASLTHAYGPAADVPAMILALASPDDRLRREAQDEMFGNVWHQGTVYPATPVAVPFLVELLAAEGVREREQVVVLLHCIAIGESSDDEVAVNARRAVREGLATYLRLLADPDPEVRTYIPLLVATFRDDAGRTVEPLRRRLETERHAQARAGVIVGLAALLGAEPIFLTRLRELARGNEPPAVQIATAVALSKLDPAAVAVKAVDALAERVIDPNTGGADCPTSMWDMWYGLGFPREEKHVLMRLPPALRGRAVDRVLAAFVAATDRVGYLQDELLDLAFGVDEDSDDEAPVWGDAPPEALSDHQRAVLAAIAEKGAAWLSHDMLDQFGLPYERAALRRLANR